MPENWCFHTVVLEKTLESSWTAAAAAAKSLQSCLTRCDPIDSSPPGSPVPGILQARTLEWVAISFSNAGKWKVKLLSSIQHFTTPWTAAYQPAPWIFQARVLEWVAIAFSTLDWKEVKPVDPKENQPWLFIERTDAEVKLQFFGYLMWRAGSWKRSWSWERFRAREEMGNRWDNWMASPTQWTWIWANSGR